MRWCLSAAVLAATSVVSPCAAYEFVRQYAGSSFFDRWDFYGSWDNLTLGDVWWLNEQDAASQGLAYVNGNGNAIIRVDNYSTVPYNQKRNSVRITTTDAYDYGSLWIIDILHLPFGCSVRSTFSHLSTLLYGTGRCGQRYGQRAHSGQTTAK